MGFELIIAATDFSPGAAQAWSQARALAAQHGARLLLVHVVPSLLPPSPLMDDLALSQTTLALREELQQTSADELAKLAAEAGPGVELETRLLEGDAARELTALARESGADLMVVGDIGVSGLAEAVFGSVASKLVRRCPCSVLVARSAYPSSPPDMSPA